jgi:hypothetical protein
VVSLRFITDAKGQALGQVRNDRFGPIIYNKVEVEERIRRAQRAILNPSTEARNFLQGDDEDPEDRQLTFSNNCVSLQISGRDVGMLTTVSLPLRKNTHYLEKADLSFVDLPGLIASVGKGGNASDIELVKKLVDSYIHKPSCLILSTVACESVSVVGSKCSTATYSTVMQPILKIKGHIIWPNSTIQMANAPLVNYSNYLSANSD